MKLLLKILFIIVALSCSCSKPTKAAKTAPSSSVILYNWQDYTSLSVLKEFEEKTGIKVILKEFETIEEQLANLQSDPNFCDLTVFCTLMADKQYLDLKLIQKVDPKKITPVKYRRPFKQKGYSGTPYALGMTGFVINTDLIKHTLNDYSFLTNPKYKGKVSLLDDSQDTYLVLLRSLNLPISAIPDDKANTKIEQHCHRLLKNEIAIKDAFSNLDDLVNGKKWIVQAYNGDAANTIREHPNLKFFNPLNEIHLWSESVYLTFNPPNKENAYKLLNFLNLPQNAASFSNEFLYSNGIKDSENFLDNDTQSNTLVNIPLELMATGKYYVFDSSQNANMQKWLALLKKNAK